jgi:hypothetical protein
LEQAPASLHTGKDPVFIVAPFGELRKVFENTAGIDVKNMRTVLMYENARFIVVVISVASDMRPSVHQQHALTPDAREPLGDYASGEPCTDNKVIKQRLIVYQLHRLARWIPMHPLLGNPL